jgi:hypothetical protein
MLFQSHVLMGGETVNPAVVTTSAWLFPANAGVVGSSPDANWSGTNGIGADDGVVAAAELTGSGMKTRYLRANTFDFAGLSIPSDATITSFEVEAEVNNQYSSGNILNVEDFSVIWVDDYLTTTVSGLNRASSEAWEAALTPRQYTWTIPADGALTKAILEGVRFAVLFQARNIPGQAGGVCFARVDYIKARVTYYV